MSMSSCEVVVYVAHLHNKRREYNNPPVLYPKPIAQESEANEMYHMVHSSLVKLI